MKSITAFMIVASAASLLACGKSEQVAAPATEPPVAEATQVEAAPEATIEPATPVVEPLPSEAVPAAPPVVTSAQPETKAAQPAAATQPAAVQPVEASPAAAAPDLVHGQKIYRQACAFCHDRGVAGAPKTGDVAAWNARLAQGMASLYTVAIRGKGAMPARGGNPSLTDADVNAAVDFMIAQSR